MSNDPTLSGKRGRDYRISEDSEVETPFKKPKAQATPQQNNPTRPTPACTPRTEERYGIEE
jgi:hypothetical protein